MYRVLLNHREIGTTLLEAADPPMGVVWGAIAFSIAESPYHLFLAHCRSGNIKVNDVDEALEFIDTQVIPDLQVLRADGAEIVGVGNAITGFREGGYAVTILDISYPFYAEEFPHHRKAYDERFPKPT